MVTSATILILAVVFVEMQHFIHKRFVVIIVIASKETTMCIVMARNNPNQYHVRASVFRQIIVLNFFFVMMGNNVCLQNWCAKDQYCVMSKCSHQFVSILKVRNDFIFVVGVMLNIVVTKIGTNVRTTLR